jgi:hypothetical protein
MRMRGYGDLEGGGMTTVSEWLIYSLDYGTEGHRAVRVKRHLAKNKFSTVP